MDASTGSTTARAGRGAEAYAVGALTLLLVAYSAWWLLGLGDPARVDLFTGAPTIPGAALVLALVLRLRTATGVDGRTRRAWAMLAGALVAYEAATVLGFLGGEAALSVPLILVSRLLRVAWYGLFASALVTLPRPLTARDDTAQFVLDSWIVGWSTAMILWHFAFYPLSAGNGHDAVELVVASGYAGGDLGLAFAAAAVVLRGVAGPVRAAMLAMIPPLLLLLGADIVAAAEVLRHEPGIGGVIGLLRSWAWLGFAIAAILQLSPGLIREPGARSEPGRPRQSFAWLPYAATVIAFAAPAIWSWNDPDLLRWHLAATAVLLALLLGRLGVTARRHARLAATERGRLIAAVDQALEAMVIADADGFVTYVNPAFTRLTGKPAGAVVGTADGSLSAGHGAEVAEALARGEAWSGRVAEHDAAGRSVDLEVIVSPLRDASGAVVGTLSVGRDMTRERALEAQLAHAQRMEAVGRLAGGVAHDFNNVLTAIRGFAELAAEDAAAAGTAGEDIAEIQRAADRATALTRQLLAFGRKQVMQQRVVDLNAVVGEVTPMLTRLIGEDVELVVRTDAAVRPVLADPSQLEQVVVNLAVNARDAMPRGGTLTIETANTVLDQHYAAEHPGITAGPHVLLAVSDTGHGMEPEVLDRAFEPFFTTKERGTGSGLGLAMVFGVVQQSNGSVHAYSEPGHGATFKIYLPAAESPIGIVSADQATPERRGGTESILVAEDEPAVRAFARRVLEGAGYRVTATAGGEEAIREAASLECLDLVFSDVVMPGMSGPDLVARLLALRPGLRVIYATGYTEETVIHRGILDRCVVCLAKPYTADVLLGRVRAVLDAPGGSEAGLPLAPGSGSLSPDPALRPTATA